MKKFVCGVLAFILICISSPAKSDSAPYVMVENYPPYSYLEDGHEAGFLVEIFRLLEKRIGCEAAKLNFLPWARSYKKLQTGEGGILFPMGMTPERHEMFKFVGPVFWNKVYLYKKRDADIDFQLVEDAKKIGKISVTRDDLYYHKLVDKGFKNLDLSSAHELDFLKLSRGRVVAVPMGESTYKSFMSNHPELNADNYEQVGPPLFSTTTYIAFSMSTPDSVIITWQRALDSIMVDGSWAEIMNRFFPPKKEK